MEYQPGKNKNKLYAAMNNKEKDNKRNLVPIRIVWVHDDDFTTTQNSERKYARPALPGSNAYPAEPGRNFLRPARAGAYLRSSIGNAVGHRRVDVVLVFGRVLVRRWLLLLLLLLVVLLLLLVFFAVFGLGRLFRLE